METYIKVYTKILENPKVGMLDDKTWRIMMELFLIAGETFDDGRLPDVTALAWRLRRTEKEISTALSRLEKIGTVTLSDDKATVTNFVKYQNTNQTAYERVKSYRNRNKSNANDNVHDNANDNAVDNVHDNADDMQMITVDKDIDIDILKHPIKGEPKKPAKEPKQKFGQFQNVLLTQTEYTKLCERFPDADAKIESLSLAIASKGYKYKDHYATVLNWARMDADKTKTTPKQEQPKKTYTFSEIVAMEDAGLI